MSSGGRVLLINKPKGITSHDVVDEVRRITGERRVGHAGTLDPMATGLLIVLVGREATKRQAEFMGLEKEYEAEITFGAMSDTYDAEGAIRVSRHPERLLAVQKERRISLKTGILPPRSRGQNDVGGVITSELTAEDVEKALGQFLGVIDQQVPPYAAVKIRGKKLYEYAREDRLNEIELPVRKVEIKETKLLEFKPYCRPESRLAGRRVSGDSSSSRVLGTQNDGGDLDHVRIDDLPKAKIRVICSKGTYIRSLAHDLGQKLGVGAYLSALRRTRIGSYRVGEAVSLDELTNSI